ncbi:hypothetical protein F1643_21545 [Azospirillum sp. INR13]|uniref:hypothetical protein n=1 Tax=unclassified Azospirillum TaxID=2630922 RepID=UPI0011EF2DBB|nr:MULTISPECIES: hypothetical protein [unclassified Azospirillum]KAA0576180.1 hypothetical protein FZ983_24315 [Azospirillum sp. B21]MBF5096576.1 hypothetical protein [Azospirillum sp. INR13]MDR6774707.1 hypothetical protein [Azospirillum sp. BE72]
MVQTAVPPPDAQAASSTGPDGVPSPAPAARQNAGRKPDILDGMLRFVLTVVVSVGVAYLGMGHRVALLEAEIAARPPVIVVDFTKMAAALQGQPNDVIETAMGRVRGDIRRLQEGGYIVLDGQSVLAAPDEAMMMPAGAKPVSQPALQPGSQEKRE